MGLKKAVSDAGMLALSPPPSGQVFGDAVKRAGHLDIVGSCTVPRMYGHQVRGSRLTNRPWRRQHDNTNAQTGNDRRWMLRL